MNKKSEYSAFFGHMVGIEHRARKTPVWRYFTHNMGVFMSMAQRVKALRESRGLSMSELARRSGVSKSLISRVEAGGEEIRLESLRAISDALGIPHGELLSTTNTLPSMVIEASRAAEQAANAQEYVRALVELHEAVKSALNGVSPRSSNRDA